MTSPAEATDVPSAARRTETWRVALQIVVFVAVEAMMEACRRRFGANQALPLPWLTSAVSAVFLLTWAFEAHSRWTFRDARFAGLDRLAPFLAIGLGGLSVLAAAGRVSAEAAIAAWPVVLSLKLLLVRAFIWRPAQVNPGAAG